MVVQKDRCIGCGACAGLCPVNVLSMDFNESGCYQPYEIPGCLDKCSICLKVCPFYEKDLEEIKISNELYKTENFYKEIGNFINTYEFYIKDEKTRVESASGGAGYYILSKLLEDDLVDEIIAVEPNNDPEKLFKFSVFKDKKSLKNSRSSAYYPVTMDEILEYVLNHNKRYAITALPCFAKAIRLTQKINPKIRKRVKFIIGLVCGQMKSKKFTSHIANESFGREVQLKSVNFRKKIENKNAMEFSFEFEDMNGNRALDNRSVSPSKYWTSRAFTPFACNNCNDTFALCADIVLMDAWLPKFIKDWRGHSLIISRNKIFDDMLKNSLKDEVFCQDIEPTLVVKSQLLVIQNKKSFFFYDKQNFLEKKMIKLKKEIQKESLNGKFDEVKFNKLKKLLLNNARIKTIKYLVNKHILRKNV